MRRVLVLVSGIRKGWGRQTLRRKYTKKWGISFDDMGVLLIEAETHLKDEYVEDYRVDVSTAYARRVKLLRRMWKDLDGVETIKKESEKEEPARGRGGRRRRTTTSETSKKKLRGRVGIYNEIQKCLDAMEKLKALHRPDLLGGMDELPDILELDFSPNPITDEVEDLDSTDAENDDQADKTDTPERPEEA